MLVAASPALAQPAEETSTRASTNATAGSAAPEAVATDVLPLADDLIAATGFRPIERRRVEAFVITGSDATRGAALRASERRDAFGFEASAELLRSPVLHSRTDARARIEHATERDRMQLAASYGTGHDGLQRQSFITDTTTTRYGAEWRAWRESGGYELGAYGEQHSLSDSATATTLALDTSTHAAHARMSSRRLRLLDLDHELGVGADIVQASGRADESDVSKNAQTTMRVLQRRTRGTHRMLSAYIHDTIRVIDSFDIRGGFVFEHWRWLTSVPPLYGNHEDPMDTEAKEQIGELLLGPTLGALYRINHDVALQANAYRRLRAPTLHQLMRPVQNGDVVTAVGDLRAETVTGGELGPAITTRRLDARAVAYWNEIASPIVAVTRDANLRERTNLGHARETGIDAAATLRIAKPLLASATYTFTNVRITSAADAQLVGARLPHTPRHRASALLAYDAPRLATLIGGVRFVAGRFDDDRNARRLPAFAVVDAMAARKLIHGLAGFVAVENLFDRRYVTHAAGVDTNGTPRMLQVGVRIDSARW